MSEPFNGFTQREVLDFLDAQGLEPGRYGIEISTRPREVAPGIYVPEAVCRVVDDLTGGSPGDA